MFWVASQKQHPLWAIVPDRPGDWKDTMRKWKVYAPEVLVDGIPLAVAVQDGALVHDVHSLYPQPDIICVGGSTE